jgi:formamidopyrimidine-DNA glycosylase
MPELPEVEALRLGLIKYLKNQKILSVQVLLTKIVSGKGTKRLALEEKKQEFEEVLRNQKILDINRRAKNLRFVLDSGASILIHLKMTGQLVFVPFKAENSVISGGHPIQISETKLPNKHTYIIFELENGILYYNDVRQFGYVLYQKDYENEDKLGFEPLEMTEEEFVNKMQKTKGILKKVFLEQKVVVGLGNIYCDEVCFAAGIRPDSRVENLKKLEIKKLFAVIKKIIPLAIELGGSSVSNYLLADGTRGNYAREHKVYLRGNKPCLVCSNNLQKIQLVGRTTVFCPFCQV